MGRSGGAKIKNPRAILLGEGGGSFRTSKNTTSIWKKKETDWIKTHPNRQLFTPELEESLIKMNINETLFSVLYQEDGLASNYSLKSPLFKNIDQDIIEALETRPLTHAEKIDLLSKMDTNFTGYFPPSDDPILNAVFRNEVMRMRLEAQEFEKISGGEKHWIRDYENDSYNIGTLKRAWVERVIPSWSTGYNVNSAPSWWKNQDQAREFLADGTTSILLAAMENDYSFDRLNYITLTKQLKIWRENDPDGLKDYLKEVIIPNYHYLSSKRSLWFGQPTSEPTEEFLNELEKSLRILE